MGTKKKESYKEEYDRVDAVIKSYTNRQLNYMNFTILLFGGSFIYLNEKAILLAYKEYYPYFLLLVYTLFVMDLYRIQVYQAYRKYLAGKINKHFDEDIINTPYLVYKMLLNPAENIFYLFYILMWTGILVAFYCFSHSEKGFFTCNALLQLLIIVSLAGAFIYKLRYTEKEVLTLIKQKKNKV